MPRSHVDTPKPVDLLRDETSAGGLSLLTLQIESVTHQAGGHHFQAAATAGGRRVGFQVELRCSERAPLMLSSLELELPRCQVLLRSIGEESDHFVTAVSAVYDLEQPAERMPDLLEFDALCLTGDPARPQLGPLQLLLFYSGEAATRRSDDLRFQWFLRIDLTQGELGFLDQGTESHAQIVAALSGAAPWRH